MWTSDDQRTTSATLIDRRRLAPHPIGEVAWEVRRISGFPVFVVDDVLLDPQYVRRLALELSYHHRQGMYPGHFAFVSLPVASFLDLVNGTFAADIGHELRLHTYYRDMTFAVIDQPAATLDPRQRQPHYDDFCDYAGVLYLNPPEQCWGGTSFWRHRRTGLEAAPLAADALRLAPVFVMNGVATSEEMTRLCMDEALSEPGLGYPCESSPYWELVDVVAMRHNRLIVYPSRMFHSPHYREDMFGEDLDHRRLTMNLYFDRA